MKGSLSAISSPMANREKIAREILLAKKARWESWRCSQPRNAPHATTAGAVIERRPQTAPIRKAKRRSNMDPPWRLRIRMSNCQLVCQGGLRHGRERERILQTE